MPRQILTQKDMQRGGAKGIAFGGVDGGATEQQPDDYISRLLKYVPAEVIAVYVFVDGIIKQSNDASLSGTLLWVTFATVLVLTPVYLWRVQNVHKWQQLVISSLSFAVWIFSMGGPFAELGWYQPILGAVLLPLFTFAVGALKPES